MQFLLKCPVGTLMVFLLDVTEPREGVLVNDGGQRSTGLKRRGSVCLVVFAHSISDETGVHYCTVHADNLLIYGGNKPLNSINETAKSLSPEVLNSSHGT